MNQSIRCSVCALAVIVASLLGTADARAVPDAPLSQSGQAYYVTVDCAKAIMVRDKTGRTGTNIWPTLPGVTFYRPGDNSTSISLHNDRYLLSFVSLGHPLMIEIIRGASNANPDEAVRYVELSLPKGTRLELELDSDKIGPLTAFQPGHKKRIIVPTVAVSGALARDTQSPEIDFSEITHGNETRLEITATDETGVASLYYSLDGTHFKRYTGPFVVDSSKTKVVWALADDKGANRGVMRYLVKGVKGDQ